MKDVKIKCNSVEEADAVLQMIEDRYPEVRWYSINKPTEWKPYDSNTKNDAKIYFDVDRDSLSYSISTVEWHKDCDWTNATSAKRFLRKSNTAIHIFQRGRMVIAHESQTGREGVAKCSPSDTFNFHTGASIALARLMAKTPDALNHDVKEEWIKVLGLTPVKKRVCADADRNFKVGDRVVVRDWDDMEKEYGVYDGSGTIKCPNGFTVTMKHLCGRTATVTSVNGTSISVDFDDKSGDVYWSYTKCMFNPTDVPAPEKEKPEAKFKVGDYVTLKEGLTGGKKYGALTLHSGRMYEYANGKRLKVETATFNESDGMYHYRCNAADGNYFYYTEAMLDKWDESKIREGDTVKVINTGLNYSSYVRWVGKHISDPYMAARFCFGSPSTDEKYKVIKIAEHERDHNPLAYIEQIDGLGFNKCYLIEVKGLVKA